MPAPVSEEIGKSDGFVSCLYDNQEKGAGASYRGIWAETWGCEGGGGKGTGTGEREGRDLTIE